MDVLLSSPDADRRARRWGVINKRSQSTIWEQLTRGHSDSGTLPSRPQEDGGIVTRSLLDLIKLSFRSPAAHAMLRMSSARDNRWFARSI